jgi:phosphotransferase system HPr-like phosphotransfer protein
MLLSKVAGVFEGTEIAFVFESRRLNGKSIMELASVPIPDGAPVDLEARGGMEQEAVTVISTVLENLTLLGLQEDGADKYTAGCREIFGRIQMSCDGLDLGADMVRRIGRALGLSEFSAVCERDATFHYKLGMHTYPSTLLPTLRAEFKSKVTLAFRRPDGTIGTADIFETLDLLCSGIEDGTRLTVKAVGEDAEFAAESVRSILENFDQVAATLYAQPGRGVAASRSVLRRFLRYHLDKEHAGNAT